jgi:hypothetical protein
MYVVKTSYRLHFNQDQIVHNQIRNLLAYNHIFISNIDVLLLNDCQPALANLNSHCIFVNFLEKSRTKRIADLMRRPNHPLSYRIHHQSAFICVHRRFQILYVACQ